MTPWEVAEKAERLLVEIYKEGMNQEVVRAITELVTSDCIGGPQDMLWDCMARVRDDTCYGADYAKRVAQEVLGPTQAIPVLAANVVSLCCMALAQSSLEQCDISEALRHLERGMENRLKPPTVNDVKMVLESVSDWATDHGYVVSFDLQTKSNADE